MEDDRAQRHLRILGLLLVLLGAVGMALHLLLVLWCVPRFTVTVVQADSLSVLLGSMGLVVSTIGRPARRDLADRRGGCDRMGLELTRERAAA
ncbi:MAG: hypothetical protein JXR96_03570 [Deltaproteobacteria bacterium]|nr:hypothetical protein [Deltaproteobacteria bacterium]